MSQLRSKYLKYSMLAGGVISLLLNVYLIDTYNVWNDLKIELGIIEPPKEPDFWAIKGWTNTLTKMDYYADVVFFGNSITYDSDFGKSFPSYRIVNLGYPGDNIEGMMKRVVQIKALSPKKIFLMAGINGLIEQDDKKFEHLYSTLVDSILHAVPNSRLHIQSILPVNTEMYDNVASNDKIKQANNLIKKICESRNLVYIDLHSLYYDGQGMPRELTRDGLHLYPESYQRWSKSIEPYIYDSEQE